MLRSLNQRLFISSYDEEEDGMSVWGAQRTLSVILWTQRPEGAQNRIQV